MALEKIQVQNQVSDAESSNFLFEFISMLNSKEISPDKIREFEDAAARIDNNEIKKVILMDKLCGDNYLSKIVAIEVLTPYLMHDDKIRAILLDNLVNSTHDSVKKAIIKTITPFINKYTDIEQAITRLLSSQYESPAIKEIVIKANAIRLSRPDLRNAVISKLKDENIRVRTAAIEALAHYSDNLEILDYLLDSLKDLDNTVKIAAIKAIGTKAERPEIKKILIGKLENNSEHQSIKETVIDVLAADLENSAEIQDIFVNIFFNDTNSAIRNAVKNVLLKNLSIEVLQDIFASKLVFEKSTATLKNSVKARLNKLDSDSANDDLDCILSLQKKKNIKDFNSQFLI